MKYLLFVLASFLMTQVDAQALQDINYNYLYNPNEKFSFQINPVHTGDGWLVLFSLQLKNNDMPDRYSISWESREALNSKHGVNLPVDSSGFKKTFGRLYGELKFSDATAPKIIAAKVVDTIDKKAWMFYSFLLPEHPVNGYVSDDNSIPLLQSYVKTASSSILSDGTGNQQPWIVSYYNDQFPAAAPSFSEGMARVPTVMKVDSTFIVNNNQPPLFAHDGLYLFQRDTASKKGFALRAYADYPKFSKLESLVDPLVYVCTKQETDKLRAARNDKKAFDRVILGVTGDTERARTFMRTYFQRVEVANRYFGSYKEGWKTDRGMTYIIFGLPDELFRFTDREVWTYKNELYKVTFDFVRSPTLFDPDNYVLLRNKKFQETWYEVVDLWRNARFY